MQADVGNAKLAHEVLYLDKTSRLAVTHMAQAVEIVVCRQPHLLAGRVGKILGQFQRNAYLVDSKQEAFIGCR